MHIKRYRASVNQSHLSRYKDLQQIKAAKKGLLNDYSQNMISSISTLQDKSSEVVESNIQRNYMGISSSNITATSDTSSFGTSCSTSPDNNQINPQKGSIFFRGEHNTQKIMTSNETCPTVEIANPIISEGLSFNLAQKPRFKKVLDLARNVSKFYQPPNRKLISKDILDVIHDQNMERNLSLIKKESDIFGLLFLGYGATISIIPLLNILVSGLNLPVSLLELVDYQGYLADGGGKYGTFI